MTVYLHEKGKNNKSIVLYFYENANSFLIFACVVWQNININKVPFYWPIKVPQFSLFPSQISKVLQSNSRCVIHYIVYSVVDSKHPLLDKYLEQACSESTSIV